MVLKGKKNKGKRTQNNSLTYEELALSKSLTPKEMLETLGGVAARAGQESLINKKPEDLLAPSHNLGMPASPDPGHVPEQHVSAGREDLEHASQFDKAAQTDANNNDWVDAQANWKEAEADYSSAETAYKAAGNVTNEALAAQDRGNDFAESGHDTHAVNSFNHAASLLSESGDEVANADKTAAKDLAASGDANDAHTFDGLAGNQYESLAKNSSNDATAGEYYNEAGKSYAEAGNNLQAMYQYDNAAAKLDGVDHSESALAYGNAATQAQLAGASTVNEYQTDEAKEYQLAASDNTANKGVAEMAAGQADLKTQDYADAKSEFALAAQTFAIANDMSDEASAYANEAQSRLDAVTGQPGNSKDETLKAAAEFDTAAKLESLSNHDLAAVTDYSEASLAYGSQGDKTDSQTELNQVKSLYEVIAKADNVKAANETGENQAKEYNDAALAFGEVGKISHEATALENAGQAYLSAGDNSDAATAFMKASTLDTSNELKAADLQNEGKALSREGQGMGQSAVNAYLAAESTLAEIKNPDSNDISMANSIANKIESLYGDTAAMPKGEAAGQTQQHLGLQASGTYGEALVMNTEATIYENAGGTANLEQAARLLEESASHFKNDQGDQTKELTKAANAWTQAANASPVAEAAADFASAANDFSKIGDHTDEVKAITSANKDNSTVFTSEAAALEANAQAAENTKFTNKLGEQGIQNHYNTAGRDLTQAAVDLSGISADKAEVQSDYSQAAAEYAKFAQVQKESIEQNSEPVSRDQLNNMAEVMATDFIHAADAYKSSGDEVDEAKMLEAAKTGLRNFGDIGSMQVESGVEAGKLYMQMAESSKNTAAESLQLYKDAAKALEFTGDTAEIDAQHDVANIYENMANLTSSAQAKAGDEALAAKALATAASQENSASAIADYDASGHLFNKAQDYGDAATEYRTAAKIDSLSGANSQETVDRDKEASAYSNEAQTANLAKNAQEHAYQQAASAYEQAGLADHNNGNNNAAAAEFVKAQDAVKSADSILGQETQTEAQKNYNKDNETGLDKVMSSEGLKIALDVGIGVAAVAGVGAIGYAAVTAADAAAGSLAAEATAIAASEDASVVGGQVDIEAAYAYGSSAQAAAMQSMVTNATAAYAGVITEANTDMALYGGLTVATEATLITAELSVHNENSSDSKMSSSSDQLTNKIAGNFAESNQRLTYLNELSSETQSSNSLVSNHEQAETEMQVELNDLAAETQTVKNQANADKVTAKDDVTLAKFEINKGATSEAEKTLNDALSLDKAEGDNADAAAIEKELKNLDGDK